MTVTPQILNIHLKRLNGMIKRNKDYESAANVIQSYVEEDYDLSYFTSKQVSTINNCFCIAQLLLYVGIEEDALKELCQIRLILDRIFVKELWFTERLLKDNMSNDDVGDFLGELPELVRFEIRKQLYTML
jgi:hypothetical protein